jgi:hypothetical protein
MQRVLVQLVAATLMSLGVVVAYAQPSLTQLKTELVSAWLVTVDGEERTRTLRITGVDQKDSGVFPLDAVYGWTDGSQTPVRAEINQFSQERTLLLTTQPGSKIAATQKSDGNFVGTFTSTSGQTKGIRIEGVSETDLLSAKARLNASPSIERLAANVPASCAPFLGGWTGDWGNGQRWFWVTAIDADCNAKYSYSPRTKEFKRATIQQGVFPFPCGSTGGTCYFEHHGGELWGRYSGTDGEATSVFKKIN